MKTLLKHYVKQATIIVFLPKEGESNNLYGSFGGVQLPFAMATNPEEVYMGVFNLNQNVIPVVPRHAVQAPSDQLYLQLHSCSGVVMEQWWADVSKNYYTVTSEPVVTDLAPINMLKLNPVYVCKLAYPAYMHQLSMPIPQPSGRLKSSPRKTKTDKK